MNGIMFAGIVTGIVVGVVLALIGAKYTKKNKKEKFTYDERQKAVRGDGYKYAFYTLMIYNVIYACLDIALDRPWAETFAGMTAGICLALVVMVIYCIWHDCYFSLNEDPKKVLIFFGIIAVINAIIAVIHGINGKLIMDGMLTNNSVNLIVAVMFGVVMIALAVRRAAGKEEED